MISGKVWGKTKLLEATPNCELHRIEVNRGGVCSQHLHQHRWNGFYVEKGCLLVRVWKNNYDLVDETILKAGDYTKVAPGEYHQFESLEDTIAFELYWSEFAHNDIQRKSVGYKKDEIPQFLSSQMRTQ